MGAYTVFLDVALGFSSPALGLIAGWTGLGSVFLASAILVLCAATIAAWLLRKNSPKEKQSWGADYPPAKRNGEWEFQAFNADKSGEQQRNFDRCFSKGQAQQDFVYTLDRMKTAN